MDSVAVVRDCILLVGQIKAHRKLIDKDYSSFQNLVEVFDRSLNDLVHVSKAYLNSRPVALLSARASLTLFLNALELNVGIDCVLRDDLEESALSLQEVVSVYNKVNQELSGDFNDPIHDMKSFIIRQFGLFVRGAGKYADLTFLDVAPLRLNDPSTAQTSLMTMWLQILCKTGDHLFVEHRSKVQHPGGFFTSTVKLLMRIVFGDMLSFDVSNNRRRIYRNFDIASLNPSDVPSNISECNSAVVCCVHAIKLVKQTASELLRINAATGDVSMAYFDAENSTGKGDEIDDLIRKINENDQVETNYSTIDLLRDYPEFVFNDVDDGKIDIWVDIIKKASPVGMKNALKYDKVVLQPLVVAEQLFLVEVRSIVIRIFMEVPVRRRTSLVLDVISRICGQRFSLSGGSSPRTRRILLIIQRESRKIEGSSKEKQYSLLSTDSSHHIDDIRQKMLLCDVSPDKIYSDVESLLKAYPEFVITDAMRGTTDIYRDLEKLISPRGKKNNRQYVFEDLVPLIDAELSFLLEVRNAIVRILHVIPPGRHKTIVLRVLERHFAKHLTIGSSPAIKRVVLIYERESSNLAMKRKVVSDESDEPSIKNCIEVVQMLLKNDLHPNDGYATVEQFLNKYSEFDFGEHLRGKTTLWVDLEKKASPPLQKNSLNYKMSDVMPLVKQEQLFLMKIANFVKCLLRRVPAYRNKSAFYSVLNCAFPLKLHTGGVPSARNKRVFLILQREESEVESAGDLSMSEDWRIVSDFFTKVQENTESSDSNSNKRLHVSESTSSVAVVIDWPPAGIPDEDDRDELVISPKCDSDRGSDDAMLRW